METSRSFKKKTSAICRVGRSVAQRSVPRIVAQTLWPPDDPVLGQLPVVTVQPLLRLIALVPRLGLVLQSPSCQQTEHTGSFSPCSAGRQRLAASRSPTALTRAAAAHPTDGTAGWVCELPAPCLATAPQDWEPQAATQRDHVPIVTVQFIYQARMQSEFYKVQLAQEALSGV